jgi:DNA-binding IclR family transcriptional regulator
MDTRSAFVLSLVDGQSGVDAIVAMSGMARSEVEELLQRLVRLGLIARP